MFLRSCPQGALPLRPDWSVMMQRPHPPSSEKTLGAHGSPGVLHGFRARWSRFISSQTRLLNHLWAIPNPLLCFQAQSWRLLLWRAAANSMARPWPWPPTSSAQAPLPSNPFGLVTLQRPPHHTTYQAPSHLLAFAQAVPWAWSTLSTSPLTSFITPPGPGQVPPPNSLP